MALRKGKFRDSSPKEQLEMLDPFVPILSNEILANSRHSKLLSKALKCLMMMLHLPLPSLKRCLSDISSHLFAILRHFSYSGSVMSNVSQELVATAFKCMTLILKDFSYSSLSDDELKLLVSYIEQDIHDYKRQSTAFPLLKVILGRRFVVEELNDMMFKVTELSIRGETSRVRANSRSALIQFLLNYPLGKKINRYLDFLIANLSYDEQCGRESVIETLSLVLNKFPQKVLVENATLFFVPIASQLINEDSSLCRQMLAEVFKTLFRRVTKEKRNELVSIVRDWLEQDNVVHKKLAVQLIGFIVDAEEKDFDRRLPVIIPLLLTCLEKKKGPVEEKEGEEIEEMDDEEDDLEGDNDEVTLVDHLLFNTLLTIEKIFTICSIAGKKKIQVYLLHPHSWVRLVSSRLMGLLFASSDIDEIASSLSSTSSSSSSSRNGNDESLSNRVGLRFFNRGGLERIRHIKQCFMGQLRAQMLSEELANQAIKNQVFLAKLLLKLHLLTRSIVVEDGDSTVNELSAGQELRNLIYQMDRLTRYEAGHHPKESMKRSCVFKWIAAVSLAMGTENLSDWLYRLIPPLYKELSNPKKVGGEDLHNLAHEVIEVIKGVSGKEAFSSAYSEVLKTAQTKRVKRKAQYALDKIFNKN